MKHGLFDSLQELKTSSGGRRQFYSLPQLEKAGIGPISKLPVSIRILLESVVRNYDARTIVEADVVKLAGWRPQAARTDEVPFHVARILLQDFTGVPLLVDLAAMRTAVTRHGQSADIIEPLVPVDLVIDHSSQVDVYGRQDALAFNMGMEFQRNRSRYEFLKWGTQAFRKFNVIPPGIGICHQVNLEFLARVVQEKDGLIFPDTLVGTDSHTTMINGLGVLGWGVGGIEAESGMLGQPVYLLTPDVVGVRMVGALPEETTATDLVLTVTELLRRTGVVGKFVEFFGPGVATLSVPDRATISNMAPEYGATAGLFAVDEQTCAYLRETGRPESLVDAVRDYHTAQGMFGSDAQERVEYSSLLELNLDDIEPSVAGPRRPQDRIPLKNLKGNIGQLMVKPQVEGGYAKQDVELHKSYPLCVSGCGGVSPATSELRNGSVVIAAVTSCTNTSNPDIMIAAGLLARKAVERGLEPPPYVKTSLAPGSRVVSDYLEKTGLQGYLDRIGFQVVGYGCSTCIGNSGQLDPAIEELVAEHDLVLASVLSGNRNFEARIHQSVRANFLMSPPLVIAFSLAGRIDIDMDKEPLGRGRDGQDVYLRDVWPSTEEIRGYMETAFDADTYLRAYSGFARQNPLWNEIPELSGDSYEWNPASTYIQEPPFFEEFGMEAGTIPAIRGARPLAILGDSITTDHISPAGSIRPESPAGIYLRGKGIEPDDFNTYGSRRGNHEVMMRGTFANVRIRNMMTPDVEGGVTLHHPGGERMSIYDAACRYRAAGTPLVVIAGKEYGSGSSRDWAAKGTNLLGVRAVIARSYERIHRSNLVGMGVLPCQFREGTCAQTLNLDGSERFDLPEIDDSLRPRQETALVIHRQTGKSETVPVTVRVDTPIEVEYYRNGGILLYVLRRLLSARGE
jgi:aconitate hydratase